MGNIRGRQSNAENIQELLPTLIKQFSQCCKTMITGLNGLDQVEVMTKEACQTSLTKSIGAHFISCKKSGDLLAVWV